MIRMSSATRFERSHASLIKRIYWIVLGLGFTFIIQDLLVTDQRPVEALAEFVYFVGLYYFLAYDWVAYSMLIKEYPYQIVTGSGVLSQGRFYIDMTHLIIKAALIFLALDQLTARTLATVALLFALWHLTIVAWHQLATIEYDDYDPTWTSHGYMVVIYGLLSGLFVLSSHPSLPSVGPLVRVGILIIVVTGFSTWRKREIIQKLLRNPQLDSESVPTTAS